MTPVYSLPSLLDSTLNVQRGKPGTAAAAAGDVAESAATLDWVWLGFAKCFMGSRCCALCACAKVAKAAQNATATKKGEFLTFICILLTDAGRLWAWATLGGKLPGRDSMRVDNNLQLLCCM